MYSDEEREATNADIGEVGKCYKFIVNAIKEFRHFDTDNDNELKTKLEISAEIKHSLK
jgi:hypothetical protein